VSRNVFDQSDEEPEIFEVPLTMEFGGPVVGTAKVDKNGVIYEGTITDEEVKRQMQPDIGSFSLSLPDPADRYKVSRHQDEMDVPYGRPPTE